MRQLIPRDERFGLAVVFFATLAGLAVGLACFGRYLVFEHGRLRPWDWLLIWIGDLTALFWFVQFFASRCLFGRPLGPARARRFWWLPVASIAAGLAVDVAYTYHTQRREAADFAAAKVVVGEAVSVQALGFEKARKYRVRARFRDGAGVWHPAYFRIREETSKGFPPGFPPAAANALRAGVVPFAIRISYDPAMPARNWATDVGPDDGWRLFGLSYIIQLFQAIGLLNFAALLLAAHRDGRDPWWSELHRALPLMVEAAFFAIFGPIEALVGTAT